MTIDLRVLILLVGLLLSWQTRAAAGFSAEQHQTFDGVVGTTLTGLNEDLVNIDALLKAQGDAFEHSSYGRNPGS